jgi:hypothetical protein
MVCLQTSSLDQKLTLIHKNIRSVHNSHVQELTLILKIISQCDVKHILTSPMKKITPYIITRENTKVTVMSRWPLYKGDRYDRFDCISKYKYGQSLTALKFNTVKLALTVSLNYWPHVKHILTSPMKKITPYIITSITARSVGLAAILAIMSVSTFKTTIILCISKYKYGQSLTALKFNTVKLALTVSLNYWPPAVNGQF